MSAERYFRRGRGRTVFDCECCGRPTRETTQGDSRCCSQCWDLAGLDNTVNDNGAGDPSLGDWRKYRDDLLAAIVAKGGDMTRVMQENRYLWPAGADQ